MTLSGQVLTWQVRGYYLHYPEDRIQRKRWQSHKNCERERNVVPVCCAKFCIFKVKMYGHLLW